LYIEKSLSAKEVKYDTQFEESIWVNIRLRNNDVLHVGLVYKSPTSSKENIVDLNNLLKCIPDKKYSHVLVMGDLNYPEIDWMTWTTPKNCDSDEYHFIEAVRDTFLNQHVTVPTRVRGKDKPSTLDLIFTNEVGILSDLNVLSPIGKSDHAVLTFSFNCYWEMEQRTYTKVLYNKADIASMKDMLSIEWDSEFQDCETVNDKWKKFRDKMKEAEDKCIPKKVIRQGKKFSKPLDNNLRKKSVNNTDAGKGI